MSKIDVVFLTFIHCLDALSNELSPENLKNKEFVSVFCKFTQFYILGEFFCWGLSWFSSVRRVHQCDDHDLIPEYFSLCWHLMIQSFTEFSEDINLDKCASRTLYM